MPCDTPKPKERKQAKQAKQPQRLETRGQERRGQDHDCDLKRMRSDPAPPFPNDCEHDSSLDQEGSPDRPVEDIRESSPTRSGTGFLDKEDGQYEQSRDQ